MVTQNQYTSDPSRKAYWQDKKVVITGGNGFIGAHFVNVLLELGASVISITRTKSPRENRINLRTITLDIKNYKRLLEATKGADLIINCAGIEGNYKTQFTDSANILDTNISMISNVLNCAVENKIPRVVLMSTAEIYSQHMKRLIEENDYSKKFDNSDNSYVLSKIVMEQLGKSYMKQYGLKVYIPRLTNVYGPGDIARRGLRVVPHIITSMLRSAPVEIWGTGKQMRTFVYVTDAVASILTMVESDTHHILNIATKKAISILDLAQLIKKLTGSTSKIAII